MCKAGGLLSLARSRWSRTSQTDTRKQTSGPSRDEVLPHHEDTNQTTLLPRAAESPHRKDYASSGTDAPAAQPRCLRCPRVDSEQLGHDSGTHPAGGEATASLGRDRTAFSDRGGDCRRPGVGEQEAGERIGDSSCGRIQSNKRREIEVLLWRPGTLPDFSTGQWWG